MRSSPERLIVEFAERLRERGVEVPVGSVLIFSDALGAVGIEKRDAVYWAGRATLVRRVEDLATFDQVFSEYFESGRRLAALVPVVAAPVRFGAEEDEIASARDDDASDDFPAPAWLVAKYSPIETLRDKDFASYSEQDWAEAKRLIERLRLTAESRRSRRQRPSKVSHGRPDVPRTVRRALGSDGEPIRRAFRAPSKRRRRLVYIVDISGSMEAYARGFLRLAHAAVSARRSGDVEVFVLGTRITRITRQLAWRDPETALLDASRAVQDWHGGTRLGEGLATFNDRWAIRGLARGAVVVILSDGWDRGDPGRLGAEMQRLRRVAFRIVWVNPLKASPGYAPIARGMSEALPFLDDFVEGHSLGSLEALAAAIG